MGNKKEVLAGVYGIFNLINGKVYIGQADDLAERYKEHWATNGINKAHNKYVNRAFKKYSSENLIFIILETVQLFGKVNQDIINLDYHEQYWLDYFKAAKRDYGYNILEKAGTSRGASFYQEESHRDKLRQIMLDYYKENPISEETRLKMGESKLGYKNNNWKRQFSEETCAKIGKSRRNRITPGKEAFLHLPSGEHYLIVSVARFSEEFKLNPRGISNLVQGDRKQYKGITGERAPQWLVNKVKPLMKPGQFWVEVDIDGNIIEDNR